MCLVLTHKCKRKNKNASYRKQIARPLVQSICDKAVGKQSSAADINGVKGEGKRFYIAT